MMPASLGIKHNLSQFLHQLFQVLLVGLTIGTMRTVVPTLAETEFGVPQTSFLLLSSFVVAFGFVKGFMNFYAGRWSETIGRKPVLILGWLVGLPIPILIWFAPSWSWIVGATILLGVNQGLTWSMTQTAKLDFTLPRERGLTLGLNEFSGYIGVALWGILTAWLTETIGLKIGLLWFGLSVVGMGLFFTVFFIQETRPPRPVPAVAQSIGRVARGHIETQPQNETLRSTGSIFKLVSWGDKRLFALCQAGLVEKFVDALVWLLYPIFLYQKGLNLTQASSIIGVYGIVWGTSQLITGPLSDRVGRYWLNGMGMWLCGTGVLLMLLNQGALWWTFSAAVTGFGMAMLYPNLSAAIADIAAPDWRGSAIGVYRFWRDLGYGIGGIGLGVTAHYFGQIEAAFWFVSLSMFTSGALLMWLCEETHPSLTTSVLAQDKST